MKDSIVDVANKMTNGSSSNDKATARVWKQMSTVRSYVCFRWLGRQMSPKMTLIRICRRIPLALSSSLKTRRRWRPRSNSQSSWPSQMKAVACSAPTTWSWQSRSNKTTHRTPKKKLTANLWWMVQSRANVPCNHLTTRKTIGKVQTITIIARISLACWTIPWLCPSKTAKWIIRQTWWPTTWPLSQS